MGKIDQKTVGQISRWTVPFADLYLRRNNLNPRKVTLPKMPSRGEIDLSFCIQFRKNFAFFSTLITFFTNCNVNPKSAVCFPLIVKLFFLSRRNSRFIRIIFIKMTVVYKIVKKTVIY